MSREVTTAYPHLAWARAVRPSRRLIVTGEVAKGVLRAIRTIDKLVHVRLGLGLGAGVDPFWFG